MPGGRVPKQTRNDPGNKPDKGLEGRGQRHIAPPGPKPTLATDASRTIAGVEKFEAVDFSAVRGGAGQVMNTQHKGHGSGSGGPQPSAQKESRGIKDASGLFAAQKGHSAKRSSGRSTKPSDIDKLKTAGS
jgi:hypothetical protein